MSHLEYGASASKSELPSRSVTLTPYEVGTLAYVDTFLGLVPCKVTAITDQTVTVRLTATRGTYQRGEILTERHPWVIPRACVYRSRQHCGQERIRNAYRWVTSWGDWVAGHYATGHEHTPGEPFTSGDRQARQCTSCGALSYGQARGER